MADDEKDVTLSLWDGATLETDILTKCRNLLCKSTEFELPGGTHEWICKKCEMPQHRYNCGFDRCLKDFHSHEMLIKHLEEVHHLEIYKATVEWHY